LSQIRAWLDSHPQEIVVLWLSKHGNPCATGDDQYPSVSVDTKRAFWSQIQQVMGDLLVNHQKYPLNSTTIADLISHNQRVVIYASDYVEFSNSSPFALDGCLIDNSLCSGVEKEPDCYKCHMNYFRDASKILAKDKAMNKFFLVSMASSGSGEELWYSFLATYLPFDRAINIEKCAVSFGIPGMNSWCPPQLQDISQLANYYNQLPLEAAFLNQWDFPNAIYLDALDKDGTIRTGTKLFPGMEHEVTSYAYATTLLLRNLRRGCGSSQDGECGTLRMVLGGMRAQYPIQRWDDVEHGRLINWPVEYLMEFE